MFNNIFQNFRFSEDKKRLASNFFSLSALQGINMILPLITLPYLVRVLGVENFGLINFALSIIMYFNILISFGFELSATREISVNRDNPEKISEIFSAVMLIKIVLLFVSFSVLTILILSIDSFYEHRILYYATFGIVVGNVLFPSWFFQGMERMKFITYVNVISKVIFTVLIFVLIKEESDFIYVPILNSLGIIIGGTYALWLVFKLFSVRLISPSKALILSQLKDSSHFFLSRLANNGSRYFATTIIGLYFGNFIVGYYVMVEKLFYAFMSLGSVVSQTIYPYMSRTKNILFFKKILLVVTGISIFLLIPILIFNEELLFIIFNEQNKILSNIFIIVFSGAVFAIVSALVGYPLLAAFGYIKYANNSLIYASVLYVLYTTFAVFFIKDIYFVVLAIPLYMIVGLGFRVYYIYKTKLFLPQ
jgi:O-antigen/teichoic acid export membrane protein